MKFFKELQNLLEDATPQNGTFQSAEPKLIIRHLLDFFAHDRQPNKWEDPRLRQREFKRCFGDAYEDDGYYSNDNKTAWEAGWREGWVLVNGTRIFFAFNAKTDKLVAGVNRILA